MKDSPVEFKVMPAFPGFFVWFIDDDGELFDRQPVIGWLIEQHKNHHSVGGVNYSTLPLLAYETLPDTDTWCIERPTGGFEFPEIATVENLDAAKACAKERANELKRLATSIMAAQERKAKEAAAEASKSGAKVEAVLNDWDEEP